MWSREHNYVSLSSCVTADEDVSPRRYSEIQEIEAPSSRVLPSPSHFLFSLSPPEEQHESCEEGRHAVSWVRQAQTHKFIAVIKHPEKRFEAARNEKRGTGKRNRFLSMFRFTLPSFPSPLILSKAQNLGKSSLGSCGAGNTTTFPCRHVSLLMKT